MTQRNPINPTPWDMSAFGMPTYEITSLTPADLAQATRNPGHYTAKVDPLASAELLHEHGFYYCDTLIEPYCTPERLIFHEKSGIVLSREVPLPDVLEIAHGAFAFGRFHRDFNLDKERADLRYDNWLRQLHRSGSVITALYDGEAAAFFGVSGGKLVLHAVSQKWRGAGLAKYLWSPVCRELFQEGQQEITSSISAANLAVLNLYASLGFGFRNATDVYHLLVRGRWTKGA
jgi:ribosomal protein S18 acetylase RimI-like enzyme